MSEKKLNILYIAHEGHLGGASKSLVTLADLIKAQGHNVTVAIPLKNSEIEEELKKRKIETVSGLYLWWQYPARERFYIKWIYKLGYWMNPLLIERFYKKLRGKKFDIVHTNSSVLDIGIELSKRLGAKHVWHFREFGEADLGTKYIRGRKKSMEMVNDSADQIIFISKAMEEFYSQWIEREKSRIIYNGIGKEYLLEKKDYKEKEKVIFLISGALQEGKGQDCAIKAASVLKRRGYDRFRLVIAGRNIANYEESLRALAKKEKVEDFVEFRGFVKDMMALRADSDVELVCSHKEAFGRVTVEAMMSSNPVIATRAGANPELVREGENGFLFEVGDFQELAGCMERFLNDPVLAYQMGRKAFFIAKASYTAQQNAREIEKVYYQILERKSDNG